jgi:hypothetical protein
MQLGFAAPLVKLKIFSVGATDRLRIKRPGIETNMAGLVEDEDGVQVTGGCRAVEQDELAKIRVDPVDPWMFQIVDDCLQRQVEALDVEQGVQFDGRHQARRYVPGASPGAAACVDQEFCADRAKAEDDDEQSRDQATGGAARRKGIAMTVGEIGLEHGLDPCLGAIMGFARFDQG